MRRKTTTQQLQQAITNNLLQITSAELYHKSTHKTDAISTKTFRESLEFLCESIFKDCIGWHYEYDVKKKQYIVETGKMDADTDLIIIAHLRANENVDREDIDKALSVIEEE